MEGNQEIRDKFCWICHLQVTTLFCPACKRSFHKECYGSEKEQQCIQCTKIENSRKVSVISKTKLNWSLKFLIRRLIDDEEFQDLINVEFKRNAIVPMNLKLLDTNIGQCKYLTSTDFLDDVLWLQHNALITDDSIRMKQITKKLIAFCEREIADIEACDECYELGNQNNPTWFSMVCTRKHPLVWAKVMGYPYEPAKVYKVQDQNITVYFFGNHKTASILPKFCYDFSEKSPNKQSYKMDACIVKEVNDYIQSLGASFKCGKNGEKFDVDSFKRHSMPIEGESEQPNSFRDNINKLIDKNQAELISVKKDLLSTKIDFIKKEKEYLELIENLQCTLSSQKRRHDDEMKIAIKTARKQRWCSQCVDKTVIGSPNFCSHTCGLNWYQALNNQPE